MSGISSRATNGKVMNTVAMTMPGTAKMTCTPCASSQLPSQPLAPYTSTSARPAITGDTENGRSMSVTSRLLPRKSNLVTAQAAASPKAALSGSEMTVRNGFTSESTMLRNSPTKAKHTQASAMPKAPKKAL